MSRLLDWIFEWFQRRCLHDPNYVSADILEGMGHGAVSEQLSVAWCQRCGATKVLIGWGDSAWRAPHATWTGDTDRRNRERDRRTA